MLIVSINNIPIYAKDYECIITRFVSCELWSYRAYNSGDKAEIIAYENRGLVVYSTHTPRDTQRKAHINTHTEKEVYILV